MISLSLIDAIKIVCKRLNDNKIKWALVGSTNTKLQGMETETRDLDIVVQLKDLKNMSGIFSDYSSSSVMELKSLTGKSAWEVSAKINDVDVQFISGDERDVYVSKFLAGQITYITLDDIEIPCFTLEAESQAYMETNRKQKADLIKEFLRVWVAKKN